MAQELIPIDISTMPELARLAEEAARTEQPRLLRRDTTDVAILSPARPRRRRKWKTITEADRAAALAAAGSWQGLVDPEQLKRDLDEARSSDRPPVEL